MFQSESKRSLCERKTFYANSPTASAGWSTYTIPYWATMINILVIGAGGGGGTGVIGAASTAAGGGGGGSYGCGGGGMGGALTGSTAATRAEGGDRIVFITVW